MGKKSRKPPKQAADAPPPPPPAREVGAADDDTSLWHGARERFHAGAVVAVAEADPEGPFAGGVRVVRFDGAGCKWVCEVPRMPGRLVGLAEDRLALDYAARPANAAAPPSAACAFSDAQGGCGRGLVATAALRRGAELFTEYPFFVVDRRSHRSRWAAYVQLRASAKRGDGDAAAALAAFDELRYDVATAPKEATVEAAGAMVDGALEQLRSLLGADAFAARREAEVETVVDVLRKFEGNQFQFEHGGPGVGAACALYRRVARANHSCAPSLVLAPARLPQRPGERVAGDGGVAVRTCCDVAAGEPLTICYGAKELVGWDVAKRRAYLEKHNGFFCRCVRCELEGAP